jgi:hypothetical protein
MWSRYCPTIQRPCIDGIADGENLVCAFWDSIDGKCDFVAGMTAARGSGESAIEAMGKCAQELGQLRDLRASIDIVMKAAAQIDAAEAREALGHKEVEHQ